MPSETLIVQTKDIMRRNVVTIDGMATVREAIAEANLTELSP